jgi:subtilisin-like proprotein convertase family protein
LYDSFGDGWNGGAVTVYVNGTAVLTGLTIVDGNGPETSNFSVNEGDDITTNYTAGQWASENSYKIYDSDGMTVAEQGASGEPGDVTSGTITVVCPACPAPIDLVVTNIGESSANLNWTETGTATLWTIKWGTVGAANNIISNVSENPYALESLTASTNYEFYVRSDCDGDSSSWNGPFSFTTGACNVSEQCIYTLDMDDTGNSWNGANIEVIQDGISLGTYTVPGGGSNEETISLCNGSNVELVWTSGSYDNEAIFSLLDPYGVSVYNWTAGNAPSAGTFHSFAVSCEPVTCPQPINLSASNISDNSAYLSWVEYGDASQWNIEWGVEGFSLGSGTLISGIVNTNYSLDVLNQSTSYSFYVQSDCGSEQSNWSGPYTFVTITPPSDNPSVCGLDIPIPEGNGNCLDLYIDVNGLWGSQLGTDVTVKQVNIIIEHSEVEDISFSLTSPNQQTVAVSYWNGNGSNYGVIDGSCTQYASFSMAGPDGSCNSATAPFLGEYTPEQSFNNWYDGSNPNGMWRLRICDSGGGPTGNLQYIEIEFNDAAPPTDIVINEIDVDQYSDTLEFVELYDGGFGNISLSGYALAFYNGSSNQIYSVFDLDGYATDENGYFVAGNAAVDNVDLVFNNGLLQDGADAVALYTTNAANLPVGTPVTTNNIYDAIVYGTGDATDEDLLPLLNAGQLQFDENELGNKKEHSCSRLPNYSGGLRNTATFACAIPTPGAANIGVPELVLNVTEFTESIQNDGSIENSIEIIMQNGQFEDLGVLSESYHYVATNIPAGLALEIEILNDTSALASLLGNADSHIESDDINNLNIAFQAAAFINFDVDDIINSSFDLSVNFFDVPPATMIWIGDTLFENAILDDGSINTSISVELITETFSVPTGNIYDFTSNNVPAGLYVDVQVIDNMHAAITLTGQAESHLDLDDISNLEIIFTDGAFTGGSASAVNNISKSNIVVDFYQVYNTETDFVAYSLPEETDIAVINFIDHTIDIWVGAGTNVYSLVADFELSTGANAYVNSNLQESGVSVNNFGLPVQYNVVAEDTSISQIWTIEVFLANQINELGQMIKIYPNPAKDFITINANLGKESIGEIYDSSGKLVHQFKVQSNKTTVDVQAWESGIYHLRLISYQSVLNQRIIIE